MQAIYDVPAPAKLNLFLHITGQRDDGYHLLESVFTLIDWHDTLHFELRQDGQITREDLSAPLPPDDLCTRAARALQHAGGTHLGAHIGIYKRVPAQAGMGGGSSDAASTLLALNRLWGLNLPLSQLSAIGLKLGADIPFFLFGKMAFVSGIGDIIQPLDSQQLPPQATLAVVKPEAGLDTKEIFSNPFLKRDSKHATIEDFAATHHQFGGNDLQPVAQALCPEIKKVIDFLKSKEMDARMTGSGSAVFAQMPHTADLTDAPSAWKIKVCKTLAVHPLVGWATEKDIG
ncbi:4-(cytidine 5'-diphospho)-2-C-methyl-D-erythritol kinase [Diaphorobacter sp. HDW4A]|uniref:4-(cytidine 5'-diphospho)-2-C-methyl-D-erythritol kinase n=1 Tax=Diaphorobacter sp. HDW4A TaxID=2714924 RepID=UPI00140B7541|nr:4-(cytidine 5'-diphospho)-2-C-methyl-D-erythritol kinase [Diaphorobacter sp. HDW4A]QIL81382.1 4-(cytidine 5'-diphospho)-2-C-methyl-D-erythritol kinase [Diaphorobacter sp. HDW4A]